MRVQVSFVLVSMVISMWLLGGVAEAQFTTGDIRGVVVDLTGAVVPGAQIQIKNLGTQLTMETQTGSDGAYQVFGLAPGEYEIRVEAGGFATGVVRGSVLVGRTTTQNISLQVGTAAETVEVTATGVLVETTKSEVGSVIVPRQIQALPLNGRQFADLATLTPGFYRAPAHDPTKKRVILVGSVGAAGLFTQVTVDGVDNFDNVVGSLLANFTLEGIQEFNVVSTRFGADQGRSLGGTINVVTKSGTNELHGGYFLFYRGDELTARDPFQGQKTNFRRIQEGVSLGGPFRKDKTFGFVAYERTDETDIGIVNTRGVFPQFEGSFPLPFNSDLVTAKVDHIVSDKQKLFGRFGLDQNIAVENIGGIRAQSAGRTAENRTQSYVFSHNYTFSPNKLNTFAWQFQRFNNELQPLDPSLPEQRRPSLVIGKRQGDPQGTRQHRLQFRDDFAWRVGSHGQHSLKLGGQYDRLWIRAFFDFAGSGSFRYFTDKPLGDPADFLFLGATTVNWTIPTFPVDLYGFYFQDDWKVSRGLTLNLGIRYDYASDENNVSFVRLPLVPPGVRKTDKNNVGPRVGFAYDPTGNGKAVIRGGYGIYYPSPLTVSIFVERLFDGVNAAFAIFGGPVDPSDPFPGRTQAEIDAMVFSAPQSPVTYVTSHWKQAYLQYWSIGTQYEFASNFALTVDYVHSLGLHQTMIYNFNRDPSGAIGTAGTRLAMELSSAVAAQFGSFGARDDTGRSRHNSLQASVSKRMSNRYQFYASYTLSKTTDYSNNYGVGGGLQVTAQDPFNFELERGPSLADQRHRVTFNGLVELPHGFDFSVISSFSSAFPFEIIAPGSVDGVSINRPPGVTRNQGARDTAELLEALNTFRASRGLASITTTSPRSFVFAATDIRLAKTFLFKERLGVHLVGEVFNVFNKPNFISQGGAFAELGPNGLITSSSFGQPRATTGVLGPGGPRAFQLAFRLSF